MAQLRRSLISVFAVCLAGCDPDVNTPARDNAPAAADEVHASAPEPVAGGPVCAPDNGRIDLPDGFCAAVFADNIGKARHLAVRNNGDVYVALRDRGIVGLRDADGDGVAEVVEPFGNVGGTGIGIYDGYLYFASDTEIVRMPLRATLRPGDESQPIVAGFPPQDSHAAKPFEIDAAGWLYVNVGAPSNACQEQSRTPGSPGMDPCPLLETRAGVWRYRADQLEQQHAAGSRYATGIRNGLANAWNRATNKLYVVQHGRDQLSELFPQLYSDRDRAELPAEEFFEVDAGDDFGWPYCYYDHLQNLKVVGPEYGGDGKTVGRCANMEDPIVAFPGHWAPNDLLFYTGDNFPRKYRDGAFIAFHGSWNRQPFVQQGYNVVFVPFENGAPAGDYEVFADGFAGVEDLRSPNQAHYRPTGLAMGPDGSLYIADSVKGRVWRVFYVGGQ